MSDTETPEEWFERARLAKPPRWNTCEIEPGKLLIESGSRTIGSITAQNNRWVVEIGHLAGAVAGDFSGLVQALAFVEGVEQTIMAMWQAPDLTNPNVVHVNMLRGTIAKPSWQQIRHLYPERFKDG